MAHYQDASKLENIHRMIINDESRANITRGRRTRRVLYYIDALLRRSRRWRRGGAMTQGAPPTPRATCVRATCIRRVVSTDLSESGPVNSHQPRVDIFQLRFADAEGFKYMYVCVKRKF